MSKFGWCNRCTEDTRGQFHNMCRIDTQTQFGGVISCDCRHHNRTED